MNSEVETRIFMKIQVNKENGKKLRSHTSLSAVKIHRETWCCITMIFLTANDACGKLSTWCRSTCPGVHES